MFLMLWNRILHEDVFPNPEDGFQNGLVKIDGSFKDKDCAICKIGYKMHISK